MAKTGRESFKFMLRLPDELRDALRLAAENAGRSVTAEIIARLEETFDRGDGVRPVWLTPELWQRVEREAQITEQDPNLIILEAVEKAFPSAKDVSQQLKSVAKDIDRRGLATTAEGRELLATIDKILEAPPKPKRPWQKD